MWSDGQGNTSASGIVVATRMHTKTGAGNINVWLQYDAAAYAYMANGGQGEPNTADAEVTATPHEAFAGDGPVNRHATATVPMNGMDEDSDPEDLDDQDNYATLLGLADTAQLSIEFAMSTSLSLDANALGEADLWIWTFWTWADVL